MNQQQIIIKARAENNVTLAQLGELFDCTAARIQQVEKGVNTLPLARIQILAGNRQAPEWARSLAYQLWLIVLMDDYAEMFKQLEKLGRVVFPNNGANRHG